LSCSNFPTTPAIPTALEIKPANSVTTTDTRRANQEAPLEISSASVSNWERGITSPSRRMTKKIREFLGYTPPVLVLKKRGLGSYCWKCGISETSPERCLFERICK
jgi:transcriptional regulator with XRE-family HTH domain